MIAFTFNFEKTLQSSGVVLGRHHGRMESIRLLKILYIADRELLAETGRTLTGDRAVAMKKGPVLCGVYDLIKGTSRDATAWDSVIRTDKYEVVLTEAPVGTGKLTKAEKQKLLDLCERYRDTDSEDLSELTHGFAEWADVFDPKNPASSYPIEWEAVLAAQGEGDWAGEVEADQRERRLTDASFGA